MNKFQEKCWSGCERLLRNSTIPFTGPIRVDGKRETYFIVQFLLNANAVELFIYVNEAGVMVNSKEWTVFEAPDFESGDLLIDAYETHVAQLLKKSESHG